MQFIGKRTTSTAKRYVVEFGIDVPGEGRVCAAESGPYLTRKGALRVGKRLLGKSARLALAERNGSTYDASDADMGRPVVGFTINVYSDEQGTIENFDFNKEDFA